MTRKAARPSPRMADLRASLEGRRARLLADMSEMMRSVRSRSPDEREIPDAAEGADASIQDDLDLAVIQMKAETLARIDVALKRLDAGSYGDCVECGQAISKERLQAMPFAVRCTSCESTREHRAGARPALPSGRAYPNRLLDATE